ncbi:aldo/keto reductase [Microbacterium sp. Au-Mic1]|uniref:aldo/keto reductase n=1 Tax=Microbacterium sp. Au-Mic1 TaxID=2906457 RepID=UPI001E5D82EA|nr:aldo/keto reductase [Microbacterium sp. Au-Mic1]MCE4026255.1 aldo/keto reductase [Microbacterium sp. Au-Mic1]
MGVQAMTSASTRPLGRGGLTVGRHTLGTASIGNLYRAVDDMTAGHVIGSAWEAGVRYFDTAPHYGLGLAEERLGRGLAARKRADVIVSTKVGRLLIDTDAFPGLRDDEGFDVPRTRQRVRDYSRDGVLRSIETSLERTGLDRIDIVLVHDPDEFYRQAMEGAFPALEELRASGVITSYGAGMNQSAMLTDFVRNTDLDIVMVAGRYTVLDQTALIDLLPEAEKRSVSVVAAGAFSSGVLATDRPRGDSHYHYDAVPAPILARVNEIADVCDAHGVTVPAVAAQFALGHPAVSTVCLGASSEAHVIRNAALFDVAIPPALWGDLADRGLLAAGVPAP